MRGVKYQLLCSPQYATTIRSLHPHGREVLAGGKFADQARTACTTQSSGGVALLSELHPNNHLRGEFTFLRAHEWHSRVLQGLRMVHGDT